MRLRINGVAALVLVASAALLGLTPTAWAGSAENFVLPTVGLSTSLELDRSDRMLHYWWPGEPPPIGVSRFQSALSGWLRDAATTSNSTGSVHLTHGYAALTARSSSIGNARVSGLASDLLRIVPQDSSLLGKPGRFEASVDVEAWGAAEEPAQWRELLGWARAEWNVKVDINGRSFGYEGRWESLDGGGSQFSGDESGLQVLTVDFVFGEPFRTSLYADLHVDVDGPMPGGDSAYAEAELGSFRWMGLSSVLDVNGNPIRAYTVQSKSGVDWLSQAVPEPQIGPILFGAFSLLTRRWRRGTR